MPDFERDLIAIKAAIDPVNNAIFETRRRLQSAKARQACPARGADPVELQADVDLLRGTLEDLGRARSRLGHRLQRVKAHRRAWRVGALRAIQRAEINRITALPVDERRAALDASNVELTCGQTRALREIVAQDGKHPLEPTHRRPRTVYAVDLLRTFEAEPAFSIESLTRSIVRDPRTRFSAEFTNSFSSEEIDFIATNDAIPTRLLGADAEATLRNLRGY